MNSEELTVFPNSNPPSMLEIQPNNLLNPSLTESLSDLLDGRVDQMSNTELAEYVKKCTLLRSSAQSRKAALRNEGESLGGKTVKKKASPKKSSLEQAMELLAKLEAKK